MAIAKQAFKRSRINITLPRGKFPWKPSLARPLPYHEILAGAA
jgi:hypothetical protein